ncbi:MAG: stage II sporulation protein M [Myxococcales bacterium]|nr:stage II sporulation protein M [Myxococcales bacterium]
MSLADRDAFVRERLKRWSELERLLAMGPKDGRGWGQLATGYRAVCADLARARSLGLPHDVQGFLDDLAGRAHNRLYSVRPTGLGLGLLRDALVGFPVELRRQWHFFLASSLLFWMPFLVGAIGAAADPAFASAILPNGQLEALEDIWSAEELSRGFGGDASMAGFYVFNNVGIAFRCFATGILGGLGSVFFLVYNGLLIGTTFGYLSGIGLGWNLLDFTSGHSAWELTGICVSGAAGMRMGWALVVTHGRTRIGSLRAAAPSLYRLVLGIVVLLVVAAAIEGFWSAGPVPRAGKYAFGIAQWVFVGAWLLFGGRGPTADVPLEERAP